MRIAGSTFALTLWVLQGCAEDHYERARAPSASQTEAVPSPAEQPPAPVARPATPELEPEPEPEPEPALEPTDISPPPLRRELCAVRSIDPLAPPADIVIDEPCSLRFLRWPPLYRNYLTVQVDERVRTFADQSDGWEVSPDFKALKLLGAACQDANEGASLRIEFECVPAILN